MSSENSISQINKLSSNTPRINVPLQAYENARQIINKQIESLKEEMNRTEIEWLNLCNLTQQSKPINEATTVGPLFKDAAELNAVPLPVKLETPNNDNQVDRHDEDEEFSDDE